MSESPTERSCHAQHAALTGWAMEPNRTGRTQKWRDGFLRKLESQVDPDGVLSPQERAARAETLRLAHLAKARTASVAAARRRREAAQAAKAQ
jgi:hypothetical protein